jgi:hypothetical protein
MIYGMHGPADQAAKIRDPSAPSIHVQTSPVVLVEHFAGEPFKNLEVFSTAELLQSTMTLTLF